MDATTVAVDLAKTVFELAIALLVRLQPDVTPSVVKTVVRCSPPGKR